MSTVLVYYSENEQIRELCEKSRMDGTRTVELLEYFERSPMYVATVGAYMAATGKCSALQNAAQDISEYDTVIIACPVWAGNPAPAVNSFLRNTDLRGKEVIGLLFGSGKAASFANDVLRKRITLAGGNCRGVVNVSKSELLKSDEKTVPLTRLALTKV